MKRLAMLQLLGTLTLSAAACSTPQANGPSSGPYTLQCGQGANPSCVRFHAETGNATRIELARVPKGEARPQQEHSARVYSLQCRRWDALDEARATPQGEPHSQGLYCLRLDTHSGEVVVLDAAELPPAL